MPGSTLNGVTAVSVRLVVPFRGVWFADVDLDPTLPITPSGKVVLQIGDTNPPMTGTVDPNFSGRFANTIRVRVVGGGGGWDSQVNAQHFHNDVGVLSSLVISTTATQVGEVALDPIPLLYPADYVRSAGPASRVFGDRDWYVDFLGITNVVSRLPAIPDPSLEILGYDGNAGRVEATCDAPVVPGTLLIDTANPTSPRWDGSLTVRDVDQVFDEKGSRATLWCSASPVSRLTAALTNMVREFSGREYLRVYRYRIIFQSGDGRVTLQAVDKSTGLPDVLPISVWPGMSGDSAKLLPSTDCLVHFIAGDPSQPIVLGFAPTSLPLERTVDASVAVHVGPTAPLVSLAGGASPLALAGFISGLVGALVTFSSGLTPTTLTAQASALNTALTTGIGALGPPATIKTVAA